MRAIALREFGSSNNFYADEMPLPEPRAGEVRVKVHAAAFNPVDYQIRQGRSESRNLRSMVLGRDLSGSVDACAPDVSEFHVGDAVYGYVCDLASSGTYAEYVCVPAELLACRPARLSHAEAAAVPVAGITAMLALEKVRAGENTSVFIAGGAGGVGTFLSRLARQRGVRWLVGTAGNPKSRAHLVDHCGFCPADIVDYRHADFAEQALVRNGGPFDIAVDLVGGRMLAACCALIGVDGQVASVTEVPAADDFELLFRKNGSYHTIGANAYSLAGRGAWRKYATMLGELARLFDHGELAPPPVTVLGALSIDVVRQAHALLEASAVQGKLVMTMDET